VLSGVVSDEYGPLGGAIVRIQATEVFVLTNEDGSFVFVDLPPGTPVQVTAWKSGYYIGGGEKAYQPGETEIELMLIRHTDSDHPGYKWISAFSSSGDPGNCQNCHAQPDDPASALPFDEWILDAHSQSTGNERFLTMYAGTDVHGNQSPLTRKGYSRD